MGRRCKSGTAEDPDGPRGAVALVVMALLSYWVLHGMASRPIPPAQTAQTAQTAQQISELPPTMLWQGFAPGGLLPLICVLGGLISTLPRRKRSALFKTALTADIADALQGIPWQELEVLVDEGLKRRGYRVEQIGGGGLDGGVDPLLTKAGEKTVVQYKQWKALKVGVSTVRELLGVMTVHGPHLTALL